jgi:O-Antigen ligase
MIGISTNVLDIQSRLSSQTFQIRLYYWKVATRMAIDRPFFGWGFDSIGDNFRRFQSLEEYQTRGAGVISDSAHNYFLDFLVAGGLPLAFILVWVWGLTLLAGFNYWNTREPLQLSTEILNEVAFTAMCIIFFVQCFINPFNIAIAFWGIFIIGSVLSLSYLPKHDSKELNISDSKRRRIVAPTKRSFLVYLIALIILNPNSASTLLWTDHKFRLAAESGNLNDLATISLESPLSNFRFNAVTEALLSEAFIPDYLRTSANIVPLSSLKR